MKKAKSEVDLNDNAAHFSDVPKKFKRIMLMKKKMEQKKVTGAAMDKETTSKQKQSDKNRTNKKPSSTTLTSKQEIFKAIKKSKKSDEQQEKMRNRLQVLKQKKRHANDTAEDVIVTNKDRQIIVNAKDDIKFGDVVTEPPKLTKTPRLNAKLASALEQQKSSRKVVGLRAQELLEQERQSAIERYRLIKAQQQQQQISKKE